MLNVLLIKFRRYHVLLQIQLGLRKVYTSRKTINDLIFHIICRKIKSKRSDLDLTLFIMFKSFSAIIISKY